MDNDKEFTTHYSYWIEKMHATFWGRVDACFNIALIVLGCAVVSQLNIDIFTGLAVTLISAFNVVVQPSRKCWNAKQQVKHYESLIHGKVTHEELQLIQHEDSDVIGSIEPLAFNRAAIALNREPTRSYNLCNKLAGLFIGDTP